MDKKIITSETAPKAVGPYSQAVESDGFVFLSGVLPVDAVTGNVSGGDIRTQTEKIFENMEAVLKAAGLSLKNVIKTTVYMTNLADFAEMNDIYGNMFKDGYPARTTVQIVALPKGVMVEIEAIAKK